jgi:5-formyltetrahydrofolate cyclo-ligase
VAIPSRSTGKEDQRQQARRLLSAVDPASAAAWSGGISAFLSAWLEQHPEVLRVAMFAALPGEPDLRSLHQLRSEREFLYPLVLPGNQLSFHLVGDPETLRSGQFGIQEPDLQTHPPVRPEEIDVVLCPGLAFAADGTRLGRGGGFYDRVLEQLRADVPRIGVGFALQWVPSLPREAHDVSMTHFVNENGLPPLRIPPAGSA